MKKAVIFGSSGFVGSHILQYLLRDANYDKVTIVVRKDPGIHDAKLKVLLGDLNNIDTLKNEIEADEIYIALGTTKNKTPNQSEYYRIDHDYPIKAAAIAKERGAHSVFLVSAVGANPDSKIFYVKTKGETERDLIALNYDHTHIFQPSMIMGNRTNEKRSLEKALINIFSFVNPLLLGRLKKFRGIDGKQIAKSMIMAARQPATKVKLYLWQDMKSLAQR